MLDSTDLLTGKLMALTEHYCDFAGVFPTARALREQIDWSRADARLRTTPSPRRSSCSPTGSGTDGAERGAA